MIVDERTLRELYLAPIDAIVHRAQPWLVMAAYNAINGPTATENPLLRDPLETQWGFDGGSRVGLDRGPQSAVRSPQ